MSDKVKTEDLYMIHTAEGLPLFCRVSIDLAGKYLEILEASGWRRIEKAEYRKLVNREMNKKMSLRRKEEQKELEQYRQRYGVLDD